jgi:hypothetical protein
MIGIDLTDSTYLVIAEQQMVREKQDRCSRSSMGH